jgi:protein-tyrosine-phosphatase
VAQADLIVCMDVSHLERMAREFPHAMRKTTLLGLFRPGGAMEMRDPYDLSLAATRDVFVEMLAAIDALAAQAPRATDAASADATPA